MDFDLKAIENMLEKISNDCKSLSKMIPGKSDKKDEEYRERANLIAGKLLTISLVCESKHIRVDQEYQIERIDRILGKTVEHNPTGNSYTKIEMWNGSKCNEPHPNMHLQSFY